VSPNCVKGLHSKIVYYCNHVCVTLPASPREGSSITVPRALSACQEIWKEKRAGRRKGPSPELVHGDREAEEVSNRRMHRSYQIQFSPHTAAAAASTPRVMIFICNNAEAAAAALLRFTIDDGTVAQKFMFLRPPCEKSFTHLGPARPLHCAMLCVRSNRPRPYPTQLNMYALIESPAHPTTP